MTPSDFSKSQVALACWRAASTELHQVMLSVGMVFKNRAEATGKDVYDIATGWLEENTEGFPDIRDPQVQQLFAKLDAVLEGRVPDKTGGALYFVAKDNLLPNTLQPFTITTTIGSLVFCR